MQRPSVLEGLKDVKSNTAIWAIEDDPGMQLVIEEILAPVFQLRLFSKVDEFSAALDSAPEGSVDLVIADLMLPERSFLSLMQSRENQRLNDVPVIVVSSVQDIETLRFCFQFGVKDYITKPFPSSELIAKIERALGQASQQADSRIVLDSLSKTVLRMGKRSDSLTTREFDILSAIHGEQSQSISRKELLQKVWGATRLSAKALDVHLVNLRRKIQPLGLDVRFRRPDQFVLLSELADN
jgi:DNA-binding response OmpR family regulator